MDRGHEVLFEQLTAYRSELLGVVADISDAEAEIIPSGFNNNIHWNLGHLYTDQFLWLQALTGERQPIPAEYLKWFGYGTNPADFTELTPSLDELKTLLRQQPLAIRQTYGERMEEVFPETEMGMFTVSQVLVRTIFHEGLHLGAILAIKRHLRTLQ
ncbi:DinB family protein [Paenibacillus tepidiphilus]|uniref:DinB family protein n=1 Tax=Paenibacillus tepidiphilus TaxID=2608683 RepID=UPI00123C4A31|nr:DinB family protein [Paenibacillus tepidiphilus]